MFPRCVPMSSQQERAPLSQVRWVPLRRIVRSRRCHLHVHSVLPVLLLLHVFVLHLLLCLLLLHMRVLRSRTVLAIQVVLGASCLCRGPPVTAWTTRGRTRVAHRGRKRVKGGVSGPAEDLRPVSEVEAGVNFQPAGQTRGQVVVQSSGRQPGGTRWSRCSAVTPFIHLEVPDTHFESPGRGLGIKQSMGWTKVCETARSGIRVLKGASARVLPDNLDHLRVEWRKRSDHKLITPSGMVLLVCGAGSHPSCHLGCARRNMPTGVNLNRHAGPRSCIRWHGENESLFGPPNQPKVTVSTNLGHSVEFQVRRASSDVPSSIRLDHGDLLVMDGLAQWEYAHRTQHAASRRGGLRSVLVCARFCRAEFPLVGRRGK